VLGAVEDLVVCVHFSRGKGGEGGERGKRESDVARGRKTWRNRNRETLACRVPGAVEDFFVHVHFS